MTALAEPAIDLEACIATVTELVALGDRSGVTPALTSSLLDAFDTFVHAFDFIARRLTTSHTAELGKRMQDAALPLLRRAGNAYRWYAKPRGYAGDYLTIAQMYDDESRGDGELDRLLDRCFLRMPAVRAVQNRRALLAREIRSTIATCGRPARITSLASGPARELFDTFTVLGERCEATLVDFDTEALAYCAAESAKNRLTDRVALVDANLIHVAVGRRRLPIVEQDLVYSIGLVDYFSDELVVKLLDWIHGTLRPGGRVLLGNFHPRNPTRAVMDHILDWKLVHRSEDDMHALFRASRFGTGASRITYEPQAINLFAECVK